MAITNGKATQRTDAAKQATPAAVVISAAAVMAAAITATKEAAKAAKSSGPVTKAAKRPCAHEGCQLYAQFGRQTCSNHVPKYLKMHSSDLELLVAWLGSLTPAERMIAFVDAFGPVRSTQLVAQLRSAGWTPGTTKQ